MVTAQDKPGIQTYERSAVFLMLKAFYDVAGREHVDQLSVEYSLSSALFILARGSFTLDQALLGRVEARMRELSAQALPIDRQGSTYTVEVINPVQYASYVEFGHRTRGGKGWVDGQYFLTLSEQDLRSLAPGLIEKKLEKRLREVFNV